MRKILILLICLLWTSNCLAWTAYEKGTKPKLGYVRGDPSTSMGIGWQTWRDHHVADYLFSNYSFETSGISGWTGIGGITPSRSTSEHYIGSYSLKFIGSSASAFASCQISPDTTYTNMWDVRVMVKSASDTIKMGVCTSANWDSLKTMDVYSGEIDKQYFYEITADGSWQEMQCEFYNARYGTEVKPTNLYLLIGNTSGMSGTTIYIDSLEIVESHGTPIFASSVVKYYKDGVPGTIYTDSSATLEFSHERTLTGLTANTKYHYTVRSDTSGATYYQSSSFSFKTPPAPGSATSFSVGVFGDERGGSYHDMCRERSEYATGDSSLTGDVTTNPDSDKKWGLVADSFSTWFDNDNILAAFSIGDITTHACDYRYRKQVALAPFWQNIPYNISIGDHELNTFQPCRLGTTNTVAERYGKFDPLFPGVTDSVLSNMGYTYSSPLDSEDYNYFYDIGNTRFVIRHYETLTNSTAKAEFEDWFTAVCNRQPDYIDFVLMFVHRPLMVSCLGNSMHPEDIEFLNGKLSLCFYGDSHASEMVSFREFTGILVGNSGEGSNNPYDCVRRFDYASADEPFGWTKIDIHPEKLVVSFWAAYSNSGFTGKYRQFEVKTTVNAIRQSIK